MFILNIATRVNKTSLIKETYTNSVVYIHNTKHTNYIHVQVVSHFTYLSQEIFFYITYCYTTINLFNQTYFDQRVGPTFSMLDFVKLLLFQFNKYKSLYCTNGNICSHFIIIPFIPLSMDKFMTGKIHIYFTTLLIRRRIYDTSTIPSGELQKGQNHLQL